MWTIYALIDPRNGTRRYVGRTENPGRRLTQHLRAGQQMAGQALALWEWLAELADDGLKPEMIAIATVETLYEARNRERAEIAAGAAAGHDLLNRLNHPRQADGARDALWLAQADTREVRAMRSVLKRCLRDLEDLKHAMRSLRANPQWTCWFSTAVQCLARLVAQFDAEVEDRANGARRRRLPLPAEQEGTEWRRTHYPSGRKRPQKPPLPDWKPMIEAADAPVPAAPPVLPSAEHWHGWGLDWMRPR